MLHKFACDSPFYLLLSGRLSDACKLLLTAVRLSISARNETWHCTPPPQESLLDNIHKRPEQHMATITVPVFRHTLFRVIWNDLRKSLKAFNQDLLIIIMVRVAQ
jgi:hypothetical protein